VPITRMRTHRENGVSCVAVALTRPAADFLPGDCSRLRGCAGGRRWKSCPGFVRLAALASERQGSSPQIACPRDETNAGRAGKKCDAEPVAESALEHTETSEDRRDPQASFREIPPLFAQEEPEDRPAPQSRHLRHPRRGRAARARGAVLQAALNPRGRTRGRGTPPRPRGRRSRPNAAARPPCVRHLPCLRGRAASALMPI
jgi:hypothetical protein